MAKVYRFGPFTLDAGRRRLLRGDEAVAVPPKALDVLVVLLENRGRTVEKDDLMARVWPDTIVEESNLTQSVFVLRRALHEGASGPPYIATIARRGYRFVGDAAELEPAAAEHRAAGARAFSSVAVLPFTLLGGASDEPYLGLGMADAIISCLTGARDVVVRPTSAITQYLEPVRDLAALGRRLRVDAIVEGTLQRAGSRLRVNVQLVDVASHAPVWAARMDEDVIDLFAVQDAIAQRVAALLMPRLSGEERRRLEVRRTSSAEAYHAYLKGRYHWARRDAEGLGAAVRWFREAIDRDPTYALAYVGLADCFVIQRLLGWPAAPDAAAAAMAAASTALEIDDTIAEAHATLGALRMVPRWDWAGADASFRRAIELAPNYAVAHNWYAVFLATQGRFDDALDHARRAVTLDPLSVVWRMGVAHMLFLARRYDEAIAEALDAIDMAPRFGLAHWVLGMACEQIGDLARASEALEQAAEWSGNLLMRGLLGRVLARSGRADDARTMRDAIAARDPRSPAPPEAAGLIDAGLGDLDAAFTAFEHATREGSFLLAFLNVSPVFDELRPDPRFARLQRLVRLA